MIVVHHRKDYIGHEVTPKRPKLKIYLSGLVRWNLYDLRKIFPQSRLLIAQYSLTDKSAPHYVKFAAVVESPAVKL